MAATERRTIEAVIKVTERCNIDCTYCYVFNMGDESYKKHPPLMKSQTVEDLADFLLDGAREFGATTITLDFHGGEPLMWKKKNFRRACRTFRERLSKHVEVKFAVQTNAILIDQDWIDILHDFQFSVGVSLDGPKSFNDIARIDHKGRGTYDRTIRGLRVLKQAWDEGLIPGIGILCVADPEQDGGRVFNHFVGELGIDNLNFLLPIDSHDDFDEESVEGYGRFLIEAYDAWVNTNDPYITVRLFNETQKFFKEGATMAPVIRDELTDRYRIITVSSNGDVGPDDSLRTLDLGLFDEINVSTHDFSDFIADTKQSELTRLEYVLSDECQNCAWKHICRGGAANGRLVTRFSSACGFDNTSIICGALRKFYSHVSASMIRRGLINFEQLEENVINPDVVFESYDSACEFSQAGTWPIKQANHEVSAR